MQRKGKAVLTRPLEVHLGTKERSLALNQKQKGQGVWIIDSQKTEEEGGEKKKRKGDIKKLTGEGGFRKNAEDRPGIALQGGRVAQPSNEARQNLRWAGTPSGISSSWDRDGKGEPLKRG